MQCEAGLHELVAHAQAKFVNGKPARIEAKYVMRSTLEWDRFMRFMERYAEDANLGFTKS
jgi:photosystem II protein